MQRSHVSHARPVLRAVALVLCLAAAGCFSPAFSRSSFLASRITSPAPADPSSPAPKPAQPGDKPAAETSDHRASGAPPAPATPPALAQAAWVVNAAPATTGASTATVYRWRHSALEELLAAEPHQRYDFAAELSNTNPVVSVNAAIALARLGSDQGQDRLVAAVRDAQLRLPMRRAAVEALASLDRPAAAAQLLDLLDTFSRDATASTSYIPELHANLLRGLARHADAAEQPSFTAALRSSSAEVRLEAVRAWAASRVGELPPAVGDLRTDPDPRVRAAVVASVVARRHPRAIEFARSALSDFHLDVRLAGVAALGQLGGDEAQTVLKRMLVREPEVVRAAVVVALAQTGDDVSVFASADDASWHVRRAVAAALAAHADQRGALVAGRLMADKSGEVRRQMVATLRSWPLERSGPLLLAALDAAPYQTRKDAAAQLAERWPAAGDFSADAPAERRSETLARLRKEWTEQFGSIDRAALAASLPATTAERATTVAAGRNDRHAETATSDDQVTAQQRASIESALTTLDDPQVGSSLRQSALEELASIGAALPTALEEIVVQHGRVLPESVYRDVLPRQDPAFAALVQLSSRNVTERRAAAKRLAELTMEKPLSPLALRRLAELGAAEPDALSWRELLRAVQNDASEAATRLAYAGMSHPSPEVRRLSCGHLGACADPRHAAILLAALDDESSPVVRAAVEALGRVGALPDARPLERLLTSDDKSLRVLAATSLARLGAASGPPALERLAHDLDPKIRRQATVAMGELGDAAYTFTLIESLDDELGVRVAALASLSRVTGQDFSKESNEPAGLAEQVSLWKRWWEARNQAGGRGAEGGARKAER